MLKTLACIVTDEIAVQIEALGQRAGWGPKQTIFQIIREGLSVLDDRITQGERACCSCEAADGEEQGAHGDWYCVPCYHRAVNEGR